MIYVITTLDTTDYYGGLEPFLATTDKNKANEKVKILENNRTLCKQAHNELTEYTKKISYFNENYLDLINSKKMKYVKGLD